MRSPARRVALITGAGRRRIGWHLADALARRGEAVAVHYHTAGAEALSTLAHLRGLGAEAEAFPADLTDPAACASLVERTLARFGRIDALACCAAVWEAHPLESLDPPTFDHVLKVNLGGTFWCARHAGLAMTAQPEGGCILTFGDWAVRRPGLDHAAYFAAKGAIPTLTRCLAVELGSRNPRVRVNCLEPGPAMLPEFEPPERVAALAETALLRRPATVDDLVRAALFLLDAEDVTGVCLPVDGGRSIYAGGA